MCPDHQTGGRAARWFQPRWFALWLGLGMVAAFPKVVLGWESFFYRDYGVLAYPTVAYFRDAVWSGSFPFWNPLSNCGAPFMAQWGTMTLYPGMLLCLLGPLPLALTWFCLGHLFLAGLGMYFLARRWTGSEFGGALAGWIFVFNGATFSCLIWPNYLVALGWMPWIVLLAQRAWREGGRLALLAALTAALQVLAGVPELTVFTWITVLALAALELAQDRTGRGQSLKRLSGIILLAAGLTAVQILPFLDLLAHSQRDAGFAPTKWAMPGWGWASFLVPLFHCFETHQGPFFQDGQGFMSSYYLGIFPVLLALGGAWWGRENRTRLLAVLVLVSLILALGENGFLYAWLKRLLPMLGVARFPVKFVLLAAFLIPLLAAAAATHCESGMRPLRWLISRALMSWIVVLVLAAFLVAEAFHYPFTYEQPEAVRTNAIFRCVWLALALGIFVAGVFFRQAAVQLALLVVLLVDIRSHTPMQTPALPIREPNLPVGMFERGLWPLAQTQKLPSLGEGRVLITPKAEKLLVNSEVVAFDQNWLGKRLALWSHLNLLEQAPKVNGSSTLQIREQRVVEDLIYKPGTNAHLEGLMDFLGARLITAPGNATEWTNRPAALPIITGGQAPVFIARTNIPARLVDGRFNPREQVFLAEALRAEVPATGCVSVAISEVRFSPHHITFSAAAAAPALVVLAQSHYPHWRATVSGQPTPLWTANYAFQALAVPAGRHEVTLEYQDPWFRLGLVCSAVSLALLAGLWWRWQRLK